METIKVIAKYLPVEGEIKEKEGGFYCDTNKTTFHEGDLVRNELMVDLKWLPLKKIVKLYNNGECDLIFHIFAF